MTNVDSYDSSSQVRALIDSGPQVTAAGNQFWLY